jgi:large subunit ribosomal protein L13
LSLVSKESITIDGTGLILGRLASRVAKLLLEGYVVNVTNVEKVVVSGKRSSIFEEYEKFLEIKSKVNPKYTPRHYRRPDNIFRATVRGMLPRERTKGKEALKRLKVFIGSPLHIEGKIVDLPDVSSKRLKSSLITLKELAVRFGWKEV